MLLIKLLHSYFTVNNHWDALITLLKQLVYCKVAADLYKPLQFYAMYNLNIMFYHSLMIVDSASLPLWMLNDN